MTRMTQLSLSQTVLIVDDQVMNIKILSAVLRDEVETLFAINGESALDIARTKNPDLILLDVMMTGVDGYEVCRRLKAHQDTSQIPVIFVTAKDQEQDEAEGFEAGAIDFITKPFSPPIVKARVRNHLELIGQRNKLKHLTDQLENYRNRVAGELKIARDTQDCLLPDANLLETIRNNHQLDVNAHFAPSSELGGDYWSLKNLDEHRIAVMIADFSGHGVNAALNTFRLHTLLNDGRDYGNDPAVFLHTLNNRLSPLLPPGQFATMFYGVIDRSNNRLIYAGAATPSPLVLLPGEDDPRIGGGEGFPLGMFNDSQYENRELPFPPGASLILYSDAVTESKLLGGGRLEEEGFVKLVGECFHEIPVEILLNTLIDRLNAGFVHPLVDDLTVVCVNRTPHLE